ncbi:hypothetical protein [Desulfovibrio cuneatus]|nr:hypothetical protein [Desulfovibrio cuneatus]
MRCDFFVLHGVTDVFVVLPAPLPAPMVSNGFVVVPPGQHCVLCFVNV